MLNIWKICIWCLFVKGPVCFYNFISHLKKTGKKGKPNFKISAVLINPPCLRLWPSAEWEIMMEPAKRRLHQCWEQVSKFEPFWSFCHPLQLYSCTSPSMQTPPMGFMDHFDSIPKSFCDEPWHGSGTCAHNDKWSKMEGAGGVVRVIVSHLTLVLCQASGVLLTVLNSFHRTAIAFI